MFLRNGIFLLLFALVISGCAATGKPMVWKEKDVALDDYSSFEIQPVVNETGKPLEQDILPLVTDHLRVQFKERGLSLSESPEKSIGVLVVQSVLLNYKTGSAFKRWLAPGAGKTQCTLRSRLFDKQTENMLAEVVAAKEVAAGGLYTVGADERILKEAAEDIAKEISRMMSSKDAR